MIKVEVDVPEITYELYHGQPIDFIIYHQAEKKFEFNQEAIEIMAKQGGKPAFLFNIGEKSIGKSFLLNQALDLDPRNNGF